VSETVLFVDDEENILRSVERLFREKDFSFRSALNARDALSIVQKEEVAVIVSDNLMPGMSGIEMLCRVRELSPSTVKVLMTAHADLPTAVAAINRSEIFRFVIKPWENSELAWVVEESLTRYRTIRDLSQGDDATLLSLARTVELKDPYTHGHCERVANYSVAMGSRLGLSQSTLKEIRYGGWLHDCGKIGVPEEILNQNGPLNSTQFAVVKCHPSWGADVARQANLPEKVINIILCHHEYYNGKGYPLKLKGSDIPLEARIVSVADAFDAMTSDRPYSRAISNREALKVLCDLKGNALDPDMVDLFREIHFGNSFAEIDWEESALFSQADRGLTRD
jgi:putative nucleotidyltransferase with HDIG domain